MTHAHDLYLTEERIRAVVTGTAHFTRRLRNRRSTGMPVPDVVPDFAAGETLINHMGEAFDAVAGPGAGRYVADSARLNHLLNILSEGTIEEVVAGRQERIAHAELRGLAPDLLAGMRASSALVVAQLRAIPQSELDAVFACLDEIEPLHPHDVARIRLRHDPEVRERSLREAAALRVGDPSRPPLTDERIRAVLEVVRRLLPGAGKLRAVWASGGTYDGYGKSAVQLVGAAVVKKIAAAGADPEALVRDLWWTQLITRLIGGRGMDEALAELRLEQSPAAWLSPYDRPGRAKKRAEFFASAMSFPFEMHCRITRDEEESVGRLLGEIRSILQ